MEPQQDPHQPQLQPQQQQGATAHEQQENNSSGGSGSSKSSFLCRQSSTRWTPTSDQIRILKDLYYNNGVRSPSAEQIQRISARLRQYGKIEGKNVFYWFQNHKARERQKKRFTVDPTTTTTNNNNNNMNMLMQHHQRPPGHINHAVAAAATNWKHSSSSAAEDQYPIHPRTKYTTSPPAGFSSPSSPLSTGVLGVGQIRSNMDSSLVMDKGFRECSISAGGGGGGGGTLSNNLHWVGGGGVDPYPPIWDKTRTPIQFFKGSGEDYYYSSPVTNQGPPVIQTLPLFPVNGQDEQDEEEDDENENDNNIICAEGWFLGRQGNDERSVSRTSLELSLKVPSSYNNNNNSNSYNGGAK